MKPLSDRMERTVMSPPVEEVRELQARIAELEDLYESMLDWRAKCDVLQARLDKAQAKIAYIESYLEGAVESEDELGLLMSAKPLLHDIQAMKESDNG